MQMDQRDILADLDVIESDLLTLVQRVRAVRTDLNKALESGHKLEPFLDTDAVAKLLDVDTAYIYSLARAGKIPSFKLGKYRRFSPLHIRKWLERKATG
jgi:excisionase family DNA binding protein